VIVVERLRKVTSVDRIHGVQGDTGAALAAVACGTFVAAAEPFTIRLLVWLAAIDTPSQRSSHTVPTPRGGGLPIGAGLVIAAVLIHSAATLTFGAAVAAFAAIGLADDLAGLSAGRRLGLQAAAGLAAAWALADDAGLGTAAVIAAALVLGLWLAAFVNAFNFMDGVNGISAGTALLAGAAYAGLGLWRADGLLAAGGAAVAAGALAFLPWNAGRARVFLGDVGSYGLGAALAVLAAWAVLRGLPPEAAIGPLALYVADTGWTLQRRLRSGERCLRPHRTHVYQRLTDAGWSHQQVTVVTGTLTGTLAVLGAVSVTGMPVLRAAADLAGLALLAGYLRAPAVLGQAAPARRRAAHAATAHAATETSAAQGPPAALVPRPRPAAELEGQRA
jgi:UDP-GlcNAc:undecaprenyl-phosphate GlcNAc-1-phosphate transferase